MEVRTGPNKQAMETHSRADSYQEEGWHMVALHSGEYQRACGLVNVFLYPCMCFTDCKETSVLLGYDRCVQRTMNLLPWDYLSFTIFIVCVPSYTAVIKKALPYPLTAPDMFRVLLRDYVCLFILIDGCWDCSVTETRKPTSLCVCDSPADLTLINPHVNSSAACDQVRN